MNPIARKILSNVAKGTLLGSALAVTHFVAAAELSGASSQIARALDATFAPLADTRSSDALPLAIDQAATRAVGAQALAIRGRTAWVLGSDAQERPAPDGFYRLSNGQILKVASGSVFEPAVYATPGKWKDWHQKISSRAPEANTDVASVYRSLLG
jgi:uncharacterized protein GlcG (DUF336 family)